MNRHAEGENGEAYRFVRRVGVVSASVVSVGLAVTLIIRVLITDPMARALAPITEMQRILGERIDAEGRARQAGDSLLVTRVEAVAGQQDVIMFRIDRAQRGISRVQSQADTLIKAQVRPPFVRHGFTR